MQYLKLDRPPEPVEVSNNGEPKTVDLKALIHRPERRSIRDRKAFTKEIKEKNSELESKHGILEYCLAKGEEFIDLNGTFYTRMEKHAGYEYHNEAHALAKAEASLAYLDADKDPLGLIDFITDKYGDEDTQLDLDTIKQIVYLVDMGHDVCDIGIPTVSQDGQISIDYHRVVESDGTTRYVHRSGLVKTTVDQDEIPIETLIAGPLSKIVTQFLQSKPRVKDFSDSEIRAYSQLAHDLTMATIPEFNPAKIKQLNPLQKFVQLTDQVGQARFNVEPLPVGLLGLIHEWEAEGNQGPLQQTPEDMILFADQRFELLVEDEVIRAEINTIWNEASNRGSTRKKYISPQDLYRQFKQAADNDFENFSNNFFGLKQYLLKILDR